MNDQQTSNRTVRLELLNRRAEACPQKARVNWPLSFPPLEFQLPSPTRLGITICTQVPF